MTSIALVSLGSIVLYIPGVYLAVKFFYVPCLVLSENPHGGMVTSLRRSWALTNLTCQGGGCKILGVILILFLMEYVAEILHYLTREHMIFGHHAIANFLQFVFYVSATFVHECGWMTFFIVLRTVLYLNVRVKEGLDVDSF